MDKALHGTPPAFRDFATRGFCGLCGRQQEGAVTQWFLCPTCRGVLGSLSKARIAASFFETSWSAAAADHGLAWTAKPVDVVEPRPYEAPRRRREPASHLDYLIVKQPSGERVAWVEMKTGRSALSEMQTFQLDCSDCDDIINTVRQSGLPAYVCHVKITQQFLPPTSGFRGTAVWWTDLYSLAEHFLKTQMRRRWDGGKTAAHFAPDCFQPLDALFAALKECHAAHLAKRLATEGTPDLYPGQHEDRFN